jgi:hypothetical protein
VVPQIVVSNKGRTPQEAFPSFRTDPYVLGLSFSPEAGAFFLNHNEKRRPHQSILLNPPVTFNWLNSEECLSRARLRLFCDRRSCLCND